MIKVVLFGLTGFGNVALDVLLHMEDVEVKAVFTEREGIKVGETLEALAVRKEIPTFRPGKRVNSNDALGIITLLKPDLIVVSTFDQILKPPVIAIPRKGVINLHPSLLPKYRGPTPVDWALRNGEKKTGLTAHFIEDEKIDSGRMICQVSVNVLPDDDVKSLSQRIASQIYQVLPVSISLVMSNPPPYEFTPQDESRATWYPKALPPPKPVWDGGE